MSNDHSPRRNSPSKHKGMKTSLYDGVVQNYQKIDNNTYNTARIFVQTTTEQPNVLPYIDSAYNNQAQNVGQSYSEYVLINQRQNNLMGNPTPGVVTNIRVSPLANGYQTNLGQTKVELQQNRINNTSSYVPPPPESFLIPTSKTIENRNPSLSRTVVSSMPISSKIPVQSVTKTFIPHHIINEIPVYSQTVFSQSANRSQPVQQGGNQESQQVLMGYYEKLYGKYEAEKQKNSAINQQLVNALNQINYLKQQLQIQISKPPTVVSVRQKRKIIDRRRLNDLLAQKWSRIVDDVLNRRKEACQKQVANIVESRRLTIKIPGQIIEERTNVNYYAQ